MNLQYIYKFLSVKNTTQLFGSRNDKFHAIIFVRAQFRTNEPGISFHFALPPRQVFQRNIIYFCLQHFLGRYIPQFYNLLQNTENVQKVLKNHKLCIKSIDILYIKISLYF